MHAGAGRDRPRSAPRGSPVPVRSRQPRHRSCTLGQFRQSSRSSPTEAVALGAAAEPQRHRAHDDAASVSDQHRWRDGLGSGALGPRFPRRAPAISSTPIRIKSRRMSVQSQEPCACTANHRGRSQGATTKSYPGDTSRGGAIAASGPERPLGHVQGSWDGDTSRLLPGEQRRRRSHAARSRMPAWQEPCAPLRGWQSEPHSGSTPGAATPTSGSGSRSRTVHGAEARALERCVTVLGEPAALDARARRRRRATAALEQSHPVPAATRRRLPPRLLARSRRRHPRQAPARGLARGASIADSGSDSTASASRAGLAASARVSWRQAAVVACA